MLANAGDYVYMVVNGACKVGDMAHLQALLDASGMDVQMHYQGDDATLVALQGAGAPGVLLPLLPDGFDMTRFAFMTGVDTSVGGYACRVTRCGYTGEDGFEIAVADPANGVAVAELLLGSEGCEPCGLGARDSAALAWSLATVGRACRPAFEAVAAGAARVPAAQWSPQALANVLWAFATQRSGYGPGRVFDALEDAVVAKADALASRDVATVLWAYAARRRLSEAPRPDAVFGAVARSPGLAARLRGASPQSLANVAWAVAALYADGGGLDDAGQALGLDAVLAAVADAAVPVARAGRLEARQLATLALSLIHI